MAILDFGGAKGSRTPDLLNAIQALSQLSYGPTRDAVSGRPRPKLKMNCNEPAAPGQKKAGRNTRREPASRFLLVVAVPDDVGDVLVTLLLLFDEGGVVHALVFDLHLFLGFLGALGRLALGRLLALGLRVRLLERDEFGLGGLRRHHLFFRRRRRSVGSGGHGLRSRPRVHRRDLHDGVAFRADDRILAEIVEFRAAIAAEALGAELGFRHGSGSLSGSKMRCLTWRVAMAVSIAAKRPAPPSVARP